MTRGAAGDLLHVEFSMISHADRAIWVLLPVITGSAIAIHTFYNFPIKLHLIRMLYWSFTDQLIKE